LRASCVRDQRGAALYLIVQAEDISERRELRERLAHAAVHDPLTGLPNRVLFTDRLETALRRSRRDGRVVAVMFLDLDHFKLVNDSLGHDTGDQLLIQVGRKLERVLRTGDTLARFGGDEFTVLCDVGNRQDALEIAGRLVEAMQEPFSLESGDQYFSLSVGVAFSGPGAEGVAELVRNADAAMYAAKERGPGHIHVHEADAEETNVYRLRTSNELHRALDRGEFVLFYQPIVELHTETMVGMEALVRWRHPTRGLLLPDDFIPVAENSGLIVPLGRWVMDEACRQASEWHRLRSEAGAEAGRLNMSVNVSARQLADPEFYDIVVDTLDRHDLAADQLWFEITESMVMRQGAPPVSLLQSLRQLGVHFEVDDFGTGYSSLSYLKQLPVETLKVDRTFVSEIDTNPDDTAIVRSVIALGDALGLSIVAEGVERNSQADALRALGCFLAQGYLFGRPTPAEQLAPFPATDLADWRAAAESSA
ncbi:MAG TPA: EAL domain-containing protein, partial [Acidimicrobiales bacterium]|nr:EAL domain-containing protein [Acidimicrobiales bacterium]